MRRFLPNCAGALAALATIAFAGSGVAGTEKPPAVVGLFTSQSCSSCPPADAVLGELAEKPGIIPLSYFVDYLDYFGWRDTLRHPSNNGRQGDYTPGRRGGT